MAARKRTDKFLKEKEENGNQREKDSLEYIKKHKIMELFDNMTSQLLYTRPADPRAFLMDVLQKLIKSRAVSLDPPSHFDRTNIDALVSMMDPTKKGVITMEQYKAGMETLGIKEFSKNPAGSEVDKISIDIFGREARKGIAEEAATYYKRDNKIADGEYGR